MDVSTGPRGVYLRSDLSISQSPDTTYSPQPKKASTAVLHINSNHRSQDYMFTNLEVLNIASIFPIVATHGGSREVPTA